MGAFDLGRAAPVAAAGMPAGRVAGIDAGWRFARLAEWIAALLMFLAAAYFVHERLRWPDLVATSRHRNLARCWAARDLKTTPSQIVWSVELCASRTSLACGFPCSGRPAANVLGSRLPWLVLLAFEIANEVVDLLYEYGGVRALELVEAAKDIVSDVLADARGLTCTLPISKPGIGDQANGR